MSTSETEAVSIVMDVMQRRPGCVLIQAAMGGDRARVSQLFDASTWLVAPTPDMRMVTGSLEQWKAAAAKINAEHPPRLPSFAKRRSREQSDA